MGRIVRAAPGWEVTVERAVGSAPRPIPLDERFLPRGADGETFRSRYDRDSFPPARDAATLIAIYPDPTGRLVIPLTVRREELRAHAGEVSLPGGAVEATDTDLDAAALREAWEEIGLEPGLVRVVGRLEPVWIPVSNFELVPVVGTLPTRPSLVPQDTEVAAIVELPLEALYDDEVIGVAEFSRRGVALRAGVFRYGGITVWGATAITLGMLARVLDGA
ncbi:MAG: CoA pyrophosphatase [Chloroflexi bacterium]|nr:CoA pyrophosphatase [Chloroflexota bacterium]